MTNSRKDVDKEDSSLLYLLKKGLRGIIAGGIAGGVEVTATYPTEYVKTQLQLDEKGAKKQYSGMTDCLLKTVQTKGFMGLYRGLGILVVGSIPKFAVRFGSYEVLSGTLREKNGQLTLGRTLLCGLGAGMIEAVFIVTPMETIKVRIIHEQRRANPKFTGLFGGTNEIIKLDGFCGLYKGLTPTVIKQATTQAIRFWTIDALKKWYTKNDPNITTPAPIFALFGMIAGLASSISNNPIDVIKTRMQGLESSRYINTFNCAAQIFVKEGPLAFFKGIAPRLSRLGINVALTFTLYDMIMNIFPS